jgi:NAD(P)-dependent dehydrogenase (short-subunit alcohol dehydrogenase family)
MLARGARKDHQHRVAVVVPGWGSRTSYAAAKGGVAQLTKALANEWAGAA